MDLWKLSFKIEVPWIWTSEYISCAQFYLIFAILKHKHYHWYWKTAEERRWHKHDLETLSGTLWITLCLHRTSMSVMCMQQMRLIRSIGVLRAWPCSKSDPGTYNPHIDIVKGVTCASSISLLICRLYPTFINHPVITPWILYWQVNLQYWSKVLTYAFKLQHRSIKVRSSEVKYRTGCWKLTGQKGLNQCVDTDKYFVISLSLKNTAWKWPQRHHWLD